MTRLGSSNLCYDCIVPDSVPPLPSLEPGIVFDRYELLCTIARGGMAHVWLARMKGKHGFERLVAVKTILPEHALDEKFRNMFLDEARIASGVEHPNVAKILDLGEWRDCLYLVMEYVDGDSLSRLRRTIAKRDVKLPTPLALRILADVCAGLHVAHELQSDDGTPLHVVHRDVSPQNVLVPVNGVPKLIDFGVAKARHRLGEETSAGFAKGKSRYMSPEQALSRPIDRRADLFSVGAMAYEIFEGSAPYDGTNDLARLHALMTGAQVTSMKNAPHPMIEKLVVKALAREPDERFATANELRAAIDDAMVALKVRASAEDVASFVATNTSERIAERRRVVKVAVDAAAERARLREIVEKGTVSGRTESKPEMSPVESAAPPAAYAASLHETESAPPRASRRWIGIVVALAALGVIVTAAVALSKSKSAPRDDVVASASPSASSTLSPTSDVPPPSAAPSVTTIATTTASAILPVNRHHARVPVSKPKSPHEVVIQ